MNIEQMNWITAEILIAVRAGHQGPVSWAADGATISLPGLKLNVLLTLDGSRTRVTVLRDGWVSVFDTMDEALYTLYTH